jgi:DNA-binding transcriptional ArsR family regulator
MVYYSTALDRTFAALADPTRRAMLARLAQRDEVSISELAKPFTMSLPAVRSTSTCYRTQASCFSGE